MGALLHALHAHQPLPLPRGPYPTLQFPQGLPVLQPAAIPGLLPKGHINARWLIDANLKAHTEGHAVKWHLVATDHEATIRALADRVNVAEGRELTVSPGCKLTWLVMGDIEVPVEYEYEPASGDGWNEPRLEAQITLLRAYLNGRWNDVEDVIPGPVLERWTASLYEGGEA